MQNNLIYGIHDNPNSVKELCMYALQQLMAVFVATVLIANICGTPVSSCLFAAGFATLVYQLVTKGSSPMFISSCGATCSAVIGALALNGGDNYTMVAVGGLTIAIIYAIVAYIVKRKGIERIQKLFPPDIVGSITIVIGLNLAAFLPTYCQIGGADNVWGVAICLVTAFATALAANRTKGWMKTIPFLIGLAFGYIIASILTLVGAANIIDFSVFKSVKVFALPDFVTSKISANMVRFKDILAAVVMFAPVACAAVCEHYSDHNVLSRIIGTDLTVEPGIHRTLLGDGIASFVGTVLCGLPNTSYGESIATTGFSKVASSKVIRFAAYGLILLAFLQPIQVFISSVPSCVFGGCAVILYGYIASSGLKTLIDAKIDLTNNKTIIVVSSVLTIGVSGIFFLHSAFAGVSLAMIIGMTMNLVLKD